MKGLNHLCAQQCTVNFPFSQQMDRVKGSVIQPMMPPHAKPVLSNRLLIAQHYDIFRQVQLFNHTAKEASQQSVAVMALNSRFHGLLPMSN
jgi:hypothetical protein